MQQRNRQMIVRRQTVYRTRATLSLHDVATQCGLHPELVERFVALGIIEPVDDQDDHFTPDATLRIQRLLRLRRDLGINYNAAALILELLERIDDLEARLQRYESESTASEQREG
jgi:hypothetical protein